MFVIRERLYAYPLESQIIHAGYYHVVHLYLNLARKEYILNPISVP